MKNLLVTLVVGVLAITSGCSDDEENKDRLDDSSTCQNDEYAMTIGGDEASLMDVSSVTLNPATPSPGQTVTVTVNWNTHGGTNVVKANAFGSWSTSSALDDFYDRLDGSTSRTADFTFTAPSSQGSYSLRLIWAYDAFGYSNYDMSNMPTQEQCDTWGDSHTPYLDYSFTVN